MNYRKILIILLLPLLNYTKVTGQIDTINYTVQTQFATAGKDYLPQWIIFNRFGILQDDTDALLRAAFDVPYKKNKKFKYSFGLDLVGKTDIGDSFIQQAYLKLKYGVLELRGGRMEETTGLTPDNLSSGSLAQSRNARPITKIALTIPEYMDVPFTKGFVEIKGYFGHGWFEEERVISRSYLHEKNIYGRFGGSLPVKAYLGFVHYVEWGGTHENPIIGKRPSKFRDYLRIMVGQEAIVDDNNAKGLESGNALGSHLGIYDLGFSVDIKNFQLMVYNQVPYEDGSSLDIFNNKDRLLGVSIENRSENKVIAALLYEYIHTTYQSGPGIPDPRPNDNNNYGYEYGGRDENYNNGFYRTGWTYKGMIIGTPLFMTNKRSENFFNDLEDYGMSIVNNRITGHHIGIEGQLGEIMSYKALATFTRNYGTYSGLNLGRSNWASMDPDQEVNYPFDPPLYQSYFLLELNTRLGKRLKLQTAIGYDAGDFSDNLGVLLGLRWSGIMSFSKQ